MCLCLILPCISISAHADQNASDPVSAPTVSAQSAVLLEAESGTVVLEKQKDFPLSMASTTKIMTALVALELAPTDTILSIPEEAIGTEGSSVYLTAGEQLTLEQLLYALLLESANDAAVAIAVGLCGSVEAFAEQMNRKAEHLGLTATHFVNPHGLDDTEHYTTAYELAIITRQALQNATFAKIVASRKATIPHTDGTNARLLINHNKLLRLYPGCIGIKTGFTKKSGRCLVSAAERNGVTLIAVTLNAPDDWNDHTALLDYGFSRFSTVLLCDGDTFLYSLPLVGGTEASVAVGTDATYTKVLPNAHGEITYTVELPRFEYAGISKGEQLGQVRFFCDINGDGSAEEIASVPLFARSEVSKIASKQSFGSRLRTFFHTFFFGQQKS